MLLLPVRRKSALCSRAGSRPRTRKTFWPNSPPYKPSKSRSVRRVHKVDVPPVPIKIGGEHVCSGEASALMMTFYQFRRPAFLCPKHRRMLYPTWNDRQRRSKKKKKAPKRRRNPHGNDSDKLLPRESGCTCLTSIRGGVQPFRRGRAPLPSETTRSTAPLMYKQMTVSERVVVTISKGHWQPCD